MFAITSDNMRELEQKAENFGLTPDALMENAGTAAAEIIGGLIPPAGKRCVVFCGRGGNGGDGFVCARELAAAKAAVTVVLAEGIPEETRLKEKLAGAIKAGCSVLELSRDLGVVSELMSDIDIVVDAIYGMGFHGELGREALRAAGLINSAIAAVFALDLPTGIPADNEQGDIGSVKADFTIAFGCFKPAHILPLTRKQCGELILADIGFPPALTKNLSYRYALADDDLLRASLKKREADSHKGTYGRVLVIAGSEAYPGAAAMSCLGALRSGAGTVELASTAYVCMTTAAKYSEVIHLPLSENDEGRIAAEDSAALDRAIDRADAIVLGCGLGLDSDTKLLVCRVLERARCTVVLDADGINAVAQNIDIIERSESRIILTPHLGELARLCGCETAAAAAAPKLRAEMFSADHAGVTLVCKSHETFVIPAGGGLCLNETGNPGLAKAGSGDLLAGIIGGLAAQGLAPDTAAVCGVYMHGRAADICAEKLTEFYMQPHEAAECLRDVYKSL